MYTNDLVVRYGRPLIKYAVLVSDAARGNTWFNKSLGVDQNDVVAYEVDKQPCTPGAAFNRMINQILTESIDDVWVVLVHDHVRFLGDLNESLQHANHNVVYGLVGIHSANPGAIFTSSTSETHPLGVPVSKLPVSTLSDDAIIIHSSLLRQGLRFDEELATALYVSDLALTCKVNGIERKVLHAATQMPALLTYDFESPEFIKDRDHLYQKWQSHFRMIHSFYAWFSQDPNAQYLLETDFTGRLY